MARSLKAAVKTVPVERSKRVTPAAMHHPATDIFTELSCYGLYDKAEKDRWQMSDIAWDAIDHSLIDDKLIALVRGATMGELTTYSATNSFMALFSDDIDFTQWLAVWLYEETKHPHALTKWLSLVGQNISGDFMLEGRQIAPMTGSKMEMLTFNIISEIVACNNYIRTSKITAEPVLKDILLRLGKDEMRHSMGFEHYSRIHIATADDPDRERIRCLRGAWAFLHNTDSVHHPVFMTEAKIVPTADPGLIALTHERIRKQVAHRIGGVVGIEIDGPESMFDVYQELKRNYSAKRRSSSSPTATA